MITNLSHATIWVTDQEVAYDFYVNKLGFEVRTDHTMDGGFRWLTVGPKTQPELELVLMPIMPMPNVDEESAEMLKKLLAKGALSTGVFKVDNCQETYDDLVAKGVTFKYGPKEQFYGIEALLEDPFGNWFSMTEPKPMG